MVPRRASWVANAILICLPVAPLRAQQPSPFAAWAIEAGGASVGSLLPAGIFALAAPNDPCVKPGSDGMVNSACKTSTILGIAAARSVGATVGLWALGKAADTDPSLSGAFLGSLAGIIVGQLAPFRISPNGWPLRIQFSLIHGSVTGLGSWMGK